MKKKFLTLIILALLGLGVWYFYGKAESFKKRTVEINGRKISLEVARTDAQRAKGLSGKKSICENCGMLFLFERKGEYSFWMKGMEFDIDIVWIDGKKIVQIDKSISREKGEKETIRPSFPADKAIELRSGASEELKLEVGDIIEL